MPRHSHDQQVENLLKLKINFRSTKFRFFPAKEILLKEKHVENRVNEVV